MMNKQNNNDNNDKKNNRTMRNPFFVIFFVFKYFLKAFFLQKIFKSSEKVIRNLLFTLTKQRRQL